MNGPTIGCLFSGYGGLSMAVQQVIPAARHAWFCEFDDAPSRILEHHWPDVPNLHDITAVDWSTVSPVDILTGGFPCQDVSVAGRRAGMTDGTRSGLWSHMVKAIDTLRPGLVVIENVGGLFSAQADSRVEPCDLHMGDADGGGHTVLLRALDSVLATLSELGYDAQWVAVRASDVGAPHGRLRVFITAHPQGEPWSVAHGDGGDAADADRSRLERVRRIEPVERDSHRRSGTHQVRDGAEPAALTLLPTPRTTDMNGAGHHGTGGMDLRTAATLLPTPMVGSTSPAAHGQISGDYRRRMDEAIALMPTPRATDGTKGGPNQAGSSGDLMLPSAVQPERFGPYAPAIHRWERVLGRPAPAPTEPGRTRPRLSAKFTEWLMGLPAGHVTAVPGLTRNQQLKALGNGVVPLQCEAALRHLQEVRDAYM